MMDPIVFIVLAVVALFIAMSTIKVVPQGRQWTVERFGRFTTVCSFVGSRRRRR